MSYEGEPWYYDDDAWVAALERALWYFSQQMGMEDHDNDDVHRTVAALTEVMKKRGM